MHQMRLRDVVVPRSVDRLHDDSEREVGLSRVRLEDAVSACPKCGDEKFYDLHCSRCGFDTVELLVTERDAACARVAELEREKDTDNLAWEHLLDLFKGAESERDAALAEVERLREALTDILRVAYKGSAAASFARAALAGSPVETRREEP